MANPAVVVCVFLSSLQILNVLNELSFESLLLPSLQAGVQYKLTQNGYNFFIELIFLMHPLNLELEFDG